MRGGRTSEIPQLREFILTKPLTHTAARYADRQHPPTSISPPTELSKTLGTFQPWGIAVGQVLSGEYFGWSQFVFAPPAIALAIGAHVHVQFPSCSATWIAVGAYIVFMALNIAGVTIAASFELIVTVVAIFELLVFMGVVAPGFSLANFTREGWIILGSSRQIFSLSRAGFLPRVLGRIHPTRHTPDVAILCGGAVGVAAIFRDRFVSVAGQSLTASIVTLSVFGAIVIYIISMASLFRLRRSEPGLDRPFAVPFFPWFPGFALTAAVVCLVTMVYFNPLMATLFVSLGVVGYLYFLTTAPRRRAVAAADLS